MTSSEIGHLKKLGTVVYKSSLTIFSLILARLAGRKFQREETKRKSTEKWKIKIKIRGVAVSGGGREETEVVVGLKTKEKNSQRYADLIIFFIIIFFL